MQAEHYDFTIRQGGTFDQLLRWRDGLTGTLIDLSGYTARMQIRATVLSTTVLLELTTDNGMILLGGTSGEIRLLIPALTTAAITWRRGVYDLELVNGPVVVPFLEGAVEVVREVTR